MLYCTNSSARIFAFSLSVSLPCLARSLEIASLLAAQQPSATIGRKEREQKGKRKKEKNTPRETSLCCQCRELSLSGTVIIPAPLVIVIFIPAALFSQG